MKFTAKILTFLAALSAVFALSIGTAAAAPAPTFTATNITDVTHTTPHVGDTLVFDASASVCDPGLRCSTRWQASWTGTDYRTHILDTNERSGLTYRYTFTTSDTTHYVTILLKYTASNSTNNFRTYQRSFLAVP